MAGSTDEDELDINNLTDYYVRYYAYTPENEAPNPLQIVPVLCATLIDQMEDISDQEKVDMKNELAAVDYLCPDVNSIELQGDFVSGTYQFGYVIAPTPTGEAKLVENNTMILTKTLTRYFKAEDYTKNGYQNTVTLS